MSHGVRPEASNPPGPRRAFCGTCPFFIILAPSALAARPEHCAPAPTLVLSMRIFRDCFFDLVVPTMSLFLFVALITLALYEAIVLARQAWPKLSFSLQSLFVGVVTCLAIAAFGLSLFAIYFALCEPYGPRFFIADVVFGSLFATVIPGVIFGVVSGILLHAHLHAPSTGKLSVGGKILIGFAFMAFLLGVSGEQLIHTLGRRLSKLSFGGAEIAFTDVTQTRRSRPEGDPTLSTISIDRTAGVPTFSLDIFTQLPDMINRDIIFINAAWSAAPPPKPTKQEIQDREKAKEGLNRALAFADAILSADVGNCLTELYSQTGDVDLLKSTLTGLMPSLRNLTTPAAYHDVDRLATDGPMRSWSSGEFSSSMRSTVRTTMGSRHLNCRWRMRNRAQEGLRAHARLLPSSFVLILIGAKRPVCGS